MTTATIGSGDQLDLADVRRRVKAIVYATMRDTKHHFAMGRHE